MSAEDDSEEDEFIEAEDGSPRCPICGEPVIEGPCKHTVAIISNDSISLEKCQIDHETLIGGVFDELKSMFSKSFSERQIKFLVRMLQLPDRLRLSLDSCLDDDFSYLTEYFQDVVSEVPGFVGAEECDTEGCGTSSTWQTTWAEDSMIAGRWLDTKLGDDFVVLEALLKSGKKLLKLTSD